VRVSRAQALPTSCVLFTGLHGDSGDLAERGKTVQGGQVVTIHRCVFRLSCSVMSSVEVTMGANQ
jgi:hypothetical protein